MDTIRENVPVCEVITVDTALRPRTDIVIEIDNTFKHDFMLTLLNKVINNTPLTRCEIQFVSHIVSSLNTKEG